MCLCDVRNESCETALQHASGPPADEVPEGSIGHNFGGSTPKSHTAADRRHASLRLYRIKYYISLGIDF